MADAALLDEQIEFENDPGGAEPVVKRGRGRPKGTRDKDDPIAAEEFYEQLAALPDEQWSRNAVIYLWRRDPWTDTTNGGKDPKYIGLYNKPMSRELIKEEHGSGTYKIQLNQDDKRVNFSIDSIEDIKYPPHIPPGDWLKHPRNVKWLPWKPIVEKWWAEKLKAEGAGTESAGVVTAADLIKLVQQKSTDPGVSSQMIELMKLQNAQNDPAKLFTLLQQFKAMNAPPASDFGLKEIATLVLPLLLKLLEPKTDPMIAVLVKQLEVSQAQYNASQTQYTALLTSMMNQKNEAAKVPGPLEQLDTMTQIMERVQGVVQPPGEADWKSTLVGAIPKALEMGGQLMAARAFAPPAAPVIHARVPPPAAPAPHVEVLNPAAAVPADPSNPNQVQEEPIDVNEKTQLVTIATFAAQALSLSLPGDQFAEQMCLKFGELNYQGFIESYPKAALLEKLHKVPEAWNLLAQFERDLPKFIDDFYAYAEGEPEEDPATPVPAGVTPMPPSARGTKAKGKKANA